MNKHCIILPIFLLLTIHLSAQITSDTIREKNVVFGDPLYEESFIIKDFNNQVSTYFDNVDFKNIDYYGKRVVVSTIFCKNGELKNTSVIKSASPTCDSIALHFVSGIKNWLPGLTRGNFVDIRFTLPIEFDSVAIKNRFSAKDLSFGATEEEYSKRKEYFDFFYSSNSQKIVNDFTYFYKYIAKKLHSDSIYVYSWEYERPKKRDRVEIKLNSQKSDSINFFIYYPDHPNAVYYIHAKERPIVFWDKKTWEIVPNFKPPKKNGTIYLEKNKNIILIGFVEGKEEPKLAIYDNIVFSNDTTLNLDFKRYDKKELTDIIDRKQ